MAEGPTEDGEIVDKSLAYIYSKITLTTRMKRPNADTVN